MRERLSEAASSRRFRRSSIVSCAISISRVLMVSTLFSRSRNCSTSRRRMAWLAWFELLIISPRRLVRFSENSRQLHGSRAIWTINAENPPIRNQNKGSEKNANIRSGPHSREGATESGFPSGLVPTIENSRTRGFRVRSVF